MKNLKFTAILIATLCAIPLINISGQDSISCKPDSATLANILAYKDYCQETTLTLMRALEINDSLCTAKLIGKDKEIAYDNLIIYSQRQSIHELTPLLQ